MAAAVNLIHHKHFNLLKRLLQQNPEEFQRQKVLLMQFAIAQNRSEAVEIINTILNEKISDSLHTDLFYSELFSGDDKVKTTIRTTGYDVSTLLKSFANSSAPLKFWCIAKQDGVNPKTILDEYKEPDPQNLGRYLEQTPWPMVLLHVIRTLCFAFL